MALREYSGNAKTTSLAGAISAAATSITVADGTGYPSGTVGPFVVTIDAGLAAEEKVLCLSRTGNTLTVSSRGWDGTTASDHGNAATVQHTLSATDLREANAHVNDTTGDPHPQYTNAAELTAAVAARTTSYGRHYASANVDSYFTTTAPSFVAFNTVVEQTGTSKDSDTRYRVATAGLWLVQASVGMAARTSDGAVTLGIRHNGGDVQYVQEATRAAVDSITGITAVLRLAANDYIEVTGQAQGGGVTNPGLLGGAGKTSLVLTRLAA